MRQQYRDWGWYATERPLRFHSNGFRLHTKPQTRGKSGRNALFLPYFRPRFNLTLEHSLIRWRFDSLHHSGGAGISLISPSADAFVAAIRR